MMQFFGWFLTRETVYLEKLKKAKKDTIYMVYTAKKGKKICQKLHSYKFGRTLCKYKVIMLGKPLRGITFGNFFTFFFRFFSQRNCTHTAKYKFLMKISFFINKFGTLLIYEPLSPKLGIFSNHSIKICSISIV